VRRDAADQLGGIAQALELGEGVARVAGLEVGMALVVELVEQAGEAPQLLLAAAPTRLVAHRGLHREAVAAKRLGADPLVQHGERGLARGEGCGRSRHRGRR
jgi:hypothetical protein